MSQSRSDRKINKRIGMLIAALSLCAAMITGCSHNSSNGGGPEVLQKKFPGAPGQGPMAAKDQGANASKGK